MLSNDMFTIFARGGINAAECHTWHKFVDYGGTRYHINNFGKRFFWQKLILAKRHFSERT